LQAGLLTHDLGLLNEIETYILFQRVTQATELLPEEAVTQAKSSPLKETQANNTGDQ